MNFKDPKPLVHRQSLALSSYGLRRAFSEYIYTQIHTIEFRAISSSNHISQILTATPPSHLLFAESIHNTVPSQRHKIPCGLYITNLQLRHDGHRSGQPRCTSNVPCAASSQNGCYRARSEDHRWRCHRIGEESAGRDHFDNVLVVRVCSDGSANLYGRPDPEMYQEISVGWIVGKSDR